MNKAVRAVAATTARTIAALLIDPTGVSWKVDAVSGIVAWIISILGPKDRDDFERLTDNLAVHLTSFRGSDGFSDDDIETALGQLGDIVAKHRVPPCQLVEMKPEDAAERVITLAAPTLVDLGGKPADICRNAIRYTYPRLLQERQVIKSLETAFRRAVFGHLKSLDKKLDSTPKNTVDALIRRISFRTLIRYPVEDWNPRDYISNSVLRPEYRAVDFFGRDRELKEIRDWSNAPGELLVISRFGQGGIGKTRLFIEACCELVMGDWDAGFLDEYSEDVPAWIYPDLFDSPKSLFLVIDYAETRPQSIRWVLNAAGAGRRPKVRVVLIARSPSFWYNEVFLANYDIRRYLPKPSALPPLTPLARDLSDCQRLYENAFYYLRTVLDRPKVNLRKVTFTSDHYKYILHIHLEALGNFFENGHPPVQNAIEAAVIREKMFLRRAAKNAGFSEPASNGVVQAACIVTLFGPIDAEHRLESILELAPDLDNHDIAQSSVVKKILYSFYADDLRIRGVGPDIVAEEFVSDVLEENPDMKMRILSAIANVD